MSPNMATDLEFLDEVAAFLEEIRTTSSFKCSQARPLQQPLTNDHVPSWVSTSQVDYEQLSSSGLPGGIDDDTNTARKTKRTRIDQVQRLKYRQKRKNERNELLQLADKLSKQVQELTDARQGVNTTERTDLVLSKSFWKQVATQQREYRVHVESERNRLLSIVNSQGAYIESMGNALRECPNKPNSSTFVAGKNNSGNSHDRIDDRKWLRLKSSDATLYEVYLQELSDSYDRLDKVLHECNMDSLPVGTLSSIQRHNPDRGVEYRQFVIKIVQPFTFENASRNTWMLAKLPHRRLDRVDYHDVTDSWNTVAFKFRLKKTLPTGSTVSILKRVLARRYHASDHVVIVYRLFSEGEGILSGMDVDETSWIRIQPDSGKTLIETCSRQIPVQYLQNNADTSATKVFWNMLQDAVKEDEHEFFLAMGKLRREDANSHAIRLISE